MSVEQYNIRVILITVIASISLIIIAISLKKEGRELGWFKKKFF